jgi:hypothetical protein
MGVDYAKIIEPYAMEPHQQVAPCDGAALLDCISSYIRRYVGASERQVAVSALWAVHTYLISEIDSTAYLAITSAEKQSGKTRLLDVLKTLVKNPWLTGQVSAAVLFRTVDKKQPTLLLDESDAAFNGDKEYAEALRGILNTGYRRGGVASRCVGKEFETKDFSTFCAKAIAGIGKLPSTVADRSIPIRLKRAQRGSVKKFRERDVEQEAFAIRTSIEKFADAFKVVLAAARPALPDELSDRQQDATESLVAIADLAGGHWPGLTRTSLISLCVEAQDSDDSIGHILLSDIRQVFDASGSDRISSTDLAKALAEIETSSWAEWNKGQPISANKVAKLLKPYGVEPECLRIGLKTPRGYTRQSFEESWSLYLRPQSATVQQICPPPSSETTYVILESATLGEPVALQQCGKPNKNAACCIVALPGYPEATYTPDSEGAGCICGQCGHHFGSIAGWRYHVVGKRCEPVVSKAAD